MPDIAMCENYLCVKTESCYRYQAHPNFMQTYGDFKPTNNTEKNFECEYFMQMK